MRKKWIAVFSGILGIFLAVLTVASYIHYDRNLPVVSTVSPTAVYEDGESDYRLVKVPIECLEVGSIYTVEIRKGLFAEEYYIAIPEYLEILKTDDEYVYVEAGRLLLNDLVVISATKDVTAGDVVKFE